MRFHSLKYLKTFQLAAAKQSFKVAAEELFVTPSAVSHQIKSLEGQLGIELFDRGPHSLTLTEAGKNYLRDLDVVFSRLESATEQLQIRYGRELVRLHLPPFFASEMFVPRLPGFTATRSDTDIHINTIQAPLQSHPPEADLSIVVGTAPEQGLVSHRLFGQSFTPACAPILLEHSSLQKPTDLNEQTLLVHEARPDNWDRWTDACGYQRLRPKKLIRFDTMYATANAAEQGLGVALVSSRLSAERFRCGKLMKLFASELTTGESYFLIHRPEEGERTDIQALKRWILDEFGVGE